MDLIPTSMLYGVDLRTFHEVGESENQSFKDSRSLLFLVFVVSSQEKDFFPNPFVDRPDG